MFHLPYARNYAKRPVGKTGVLILRREDSMVDTYHPRPCFKRPGLILVLLMLMKVVALPGDPGRATSINNDDAATCEGAFLLVGSFGNDSVNRYQGTTGAFIDTFVPSSGGGLDGPNDLAFGPDGSLYVSSRNTHSILRYNGITGAFIEAFIPSGVGGLTYPEGLVFGPDSNLYVSSSTNSILRYDGTTGAFIDVFVPPGSGGLDLPDHLIFGADGNLYVISRNTKSILRYGGTTGAFIDIFVPSGSGGLDTPFDSAFGPDGNFYVSSGGTVNNTFSSRVGRYNGTTGEFIDTFVPTDSDSLFQPNYLVFGPDGNLYVNGIIDSNIFTAQVRRYNGLTGAFIDLFVSPSNNGGLNGPTKMVFSCLADLSITKTDNPDPVLGGSDLTYNLKVTNNGPASATGVKVTDTLPSSVGFVSATPSQGTCSGSSTVTCELDDLAVGATATVAIVVRVPAEMEGTLTNTAKVEGNEGDPDPANNTATQRTKVVRLLLTISPASVTGPCQTSTGTVSQSSPAPLGGTLISLNNTNPAAVVPSNVTIPNGSTSTNFTITTTAVSTTRTGTVTARDAAKNIVSPGKTFKVLPVGVQSVSFSPSQVAGGSNATGTVTLECPAAPGSITVSLRSADPSIANPTVGSITIPMGEINGSFTASSNDVPAPTRVVIGATANGRTKNGTLKVRPSIEVASVELSPNPVVSPNNVTGTVTLNRAASTGGVTITLASSDPAVANPAVESITIPAGATSGNFTVTTSVVSSLSFATINAAANGLSKGKKLTVKPPTTGTVVAGEDHIFALAPDGTLWAWGHNGYGQLGEGTTAHRLKPVRVAALANVRAAAGGGAHSLALKTDGSVWAWGWNRDGQLGDGTTTDRSIPSQLNGISEVAAISAGKSHSLAVKSDGTLWSWGRNQFGQLGHGTTDNQNVPVQVNGLNGVIAVAAGEGHSLALLSDGTVWAWGWNEFGQLGDTTITNRITPVRVSGLTGVIAVAAGFYHNLALKTDGTVWVWGRNNWSQLGDGTTTDRTTPVRVKGLTSVKAVAAGFYHSLALKTNGTVWNWGDKTFGQLANDSSNTVPWAAEAKPVQAIGVKNAIAIAGGKFHSLALKSDGSIQAWGANWYGQLSNGTADYDRHTTPVDVNEIHFGAKVAAPVISPQGGTFVNSASVSLTTSTPGATIRYTTDGTDPTSAATLYNGTFTVNTNSTVKARAFRSGYANSEVASASFDINSVASDSGDGLAVTYYYDFELSGASVSRIDPVINFTWGQGAPDPAIREDGFSSRWTGQVKAQYSEAYTFHIFADDAVRLWVNDQLIIDHWFYDGQEASGTIALEAGVKYKVRLEHRDGSAGSAIFFKWSSPSTPKATIPQGQLYSQAINDTDGDGLPDDWEQEHFGDLNQNGGGDFDNDGLTNREEYDAGTNPTLTDTDSDGMPDGWEVHYGLDPKQNDANSDPDGDAVNNVTEYLQGRNPTRGAVSDTNGVVRLQVFTPLENRILR